jgi:hypothetical protein
VDESRVNHTLRVNYAMVIVHGATPRRDTQPDSPGAVFPAVDFRSVCNFTLCPLSHYSPNGTEAVRKL